MTEEVRVVGAEKLAALARDLKAAGTEGKGLRLALLRQLRVIAKPIQTDVQRNAFNIPAKGPATRGLRVAIMRATRTKVSTSGRTSSVTVIVDPAKMPDGMQGLPALMEGPKKWRKPVFGNKEVWEDQPTHPYVAPAATKHQNDASIAALAAIDEVAAKLNRGG